jgi:hypothetical protein
LRSRPSPVLCLEFWTLKRVDARRKGKWEETRRKKLTTRRQKGRGRKREKRGDSDKCGRLLMVMYGKGDDRITAPACGFLCDIGSSSGHAGH